MTTISQFHLRICVSFKATMSPCTADELRCRNGKCVKRIWICDGEDDCEDGTDELTCGKILQAMCLFMSEVHLLKCDCSLIRFDCCRGTIV